MHENHKNNQRFSNKICMEAARFYYEGKFVQNIPKLELECNSALSEHLMKIVLQRPAWLLLL